MKAVIFLLTILSFLFLSGCVPKQNSSGLKKEPLTSKGGETEVINQKKILMVVAPVDFQEKEYQIPKTILENSGYQVVTATKEVKSAKSSSGTSVIVDKLLEETNIDEFEAIVFVGGPGTTVYFNDQTTLALAQAAYQKGKAIGAICIAPSILANAGVLRDKKATAFPSEEANLKEKGAIYTGESVTVDGKIVTADGPSAAEEFGQKLSELLDRE